MISKSGVYALRALTLLAELGPGRYAGAGELARRLDAPPNYLGKLLNALARGGIVASQKGSGGGYRLEADPTGVRLVDVLELVEDVERWQDCCLGFDRCTEEHPCALHEQWKPIRERFLEMISSGTIADLEPGSVSPHPGDRTRARRKTAARSTGRGT